VSSVNSYLYKNTPYVISLLCSRLWKKCQWIKWARIFSQAESNTLSPFDHLIKEQSIRWRVFFTFVSSAWQKSLLWTCTEPALCVAGYKINATEFDCRKNVILLPVNAHSLEWGEELELGYELSFNFQLCTYHGIIHDMTTSSQWFVLHTEDEGKLLIMNNYMNMNCGEE
jgi:hypothetical protein